MNKKVAKHKIDSRDSKINLPTNEEGHRDNAVQQKKMKTSQRLIKKYSQQEKAEDTEITKFIEGFKSFGHDVVSCFTRGYCYWFSFILNTRFPGGTICYNTMNHYVYRYEGRLYDITGDCTEEWDNGFLYTWDEYTEMESGSCHLNRLIQCCILKNSDV